MAENALIIYFKPGCSKCKTAVDSLENKGYSCNLIEYLLTPPTKEELLDILSKLNKKPSEIVRKSEELYSKKFAGKKISEKQWIKALLKYPVLIQRPIVIKGNKAWIARDEQSLSEI